MVSELDVNYDRETPYSNIVFIDLINCVLNLSRYSESDSNLLCRNVQSFLFISRT